MAKRPSRKTSDAVAWSLGVWRMGPKEGQEFLRASVSSRLQRILNRRAVANYLMDATQSSASLDWSGASASGDKIEVERRGTKAPRWGFFETNDAANAFRVCQAPGGTAAVVAAWSGQRRFNNPDSAIRVDVCAYVVLWNGATAEKHLLSGFPGILWEHIEQDPDALVSLDSLVCSSLACALTALAHEPGESIPGWLALHREALLQESLAVAPKKSLGPRF